MLGKPTRSGAGRRRSDEDAPTIYTSSRATKILGFTLLAGLLLLCLFAFIFSPPDSRPGPEGSPIGQLDAVRLMYVHVPAAIWAYVGFGLCALGSGMYLWKRSLWWDRLAHSCGEIGLVFCGITLLTGMIWGRPTWGTWWDWGDVRLVTTLMLFLVYLGYIAVRSGAGAPAQRAVRGAVLGLAGVVLIPIVNRSVEWWENRTLHQQSTLAELRIKDLTLFTLVLGIVVGGLGFAWLLLHRFRVAWLEGEAERWALQVAIEQRKAEAQQEESRLSEQQETRQR